MSKTRKEERIIFRNAFYSYIRRHFFVLLALVVIAVVFYLVFSLYTLPTEAVMYAALLSLIGIIIIGAGSFFRYYKRVRSLERLKKCILVSIDELPEPRDLLERNYQELLRLVNDDRVAGISQKDKLISDMIDYYSIWAHQIKTPIAALRLMKETEANDEISDQIFKIEQYVEMVLCYIRTESVSGDLVVRHCSLDTIIRQSVRKYSKQFIRKKLSLEYEEVGITVVTDEKWLCFMIEQLLSNAIKYTQTGHIGIYVSENPNVVGAASKIGFTLIIEDTGIGIPAEDVPRLGEKGFTGFNGHEDKKSTGIGLYLCKKTADRLGLSLKIESEPGRGTKVSINGFEM